MPATRIWSSALLVPALVLTAAASPAAAHHARLSADLADHLRAGTQSIDVIVSMQDLGRQFDKRTAASVFGSKPNQR